MCPTQASHQKYKKQNRSPPNGPLNKLCIELPFSRFPANTTLNNSFNCSQRNLLFERKQGKQPHK